MPHLRSKHDQPQACGYHGATISLSQCIWLFSTLLVSAMISVLHMLQALDNCRAPRDHAFSCTASSCMTFCPIQSSLSCCCRWQLHFAAMLFGTRRFTPATDDACVSVYTVGSGAVAADVRQHRTNNTADEGLTNTLKHAVSISPTTVSLSPIKTLSIVLIIQCIHTCECGSWLGQ